VSNLAGYNPAMESGALSAADSAVIENVKQLSDVFRERAEQTDQLGAMNDNLRSNIHHLAKMGFFGSNILPEFGGLGLGSYAGKTCLQIIASACGVTAFTQQQLHSGGGFFREIPNAELQKKMLPLFASGEHLCGVGFSHLRRPGPPLVVAKRTAIGYIINGKVPWITAWSLLDSFILGATVEDGSMIFCFLPIKEFKNCLSPSTPMKLSTMDASDTIELGLKDIEMPIGYVLSERPPDHMLISDFRGITNHVDPPIGCALGSAKFLRTLAERRSRPDLIEFAVKIEDEIKRTVELTQTWSGARHEETEYRNNALGARTGAIMLAIRAAAAGIAAAGGSAHLTTSPAQRRFREAAFYATAAQTFDIQRTLLEAFTNG
jgi:alkylation response protein AidB-like acyl-CoA dehydrogenase